MCKSKEQKANEAAQLQAQKQQIQSNEVMAKFMNAFLPLFQSQKAAEEEWMTSQVDPYLKEYSATGFAPGERERMRAQSSEDVGRAARMAESTGLSAMGAAGYNSEAPSGMMSAFRKDLARNTAEALTKGWRDIESLGAERRFATIPLKMSRGGMFNPLGYAGAATGFRAGNVQEANIQAPWWQQLANTAIGMGVGAGKTALGKWGG